ncbi:MAG: hypothetical protein HZA62_07875 [Rhodocyclales bacterium]|nr:hypothetical protein [Rhodocyclales bacterium]
MKKILLPLLIITLLSVSALYRLAESLDEIVADAIAHHGTVMTQARIGVERVDIAPKNGKGIISGLLIGNPKGFKTPYALRVERIDLDIDLATLNKDVTVVRLLIIDKPDVFYETGDTQTNFGAIQKNIAAYLGPARTKNRGETLLIIEELTICNANAHASAPFMGDKTISIALPDIVLKNVGKAKGGVTPAELGQEIASAMTAKLSVAGNYERLKKSAGTTLDRAGSAILSLFK